MSKRRLSATSENQPRFLSKRRNDFIEASIPTSVPRPFAFPVALHSDIVRLSWISLFLLPIYGSRRSFRGSQGVFGCESPSACRLRYLRRRLDRCVCLLLHGGRAQDTSCTQPGESYNCLRGRISRVVQEVPDDRYDQSLDGKPYSQAHQGARFDAVTWAKKVFGDVLSGFSC